MKVNTIKKSVRMNAELHALVETYRESHKASFSEALENLVLKGLENAQAIANIQKLFKEELKAVRAEIQNQANRLAGININHFKFSGRIYAHTFSTYKRQPGVSNDEINQLEQHGINKALSDLKVKHIGGEE